ncbi:MAG: hypothetical protein JNK69_09680 [Saprospiraceae bacterium]|nr:hypothetical protein [Candidatus Vicinibacter proximus]MBL7823668.1 hypothetical protein [Saprospiraceae bacterium]MCC6844536.1 hypothetical protein [Saprospiraceae bacterium]
MLRLNKLIAFIIICNSFWLAGCCKIEPEEQLFIFGRYFGECVGDCGTFYKLTVQSLLPDKEAYYNNQKINFSNQPLSEIKENLVRNLFKEFPKSLYNIKEHIIGCPDCADQGGYYLEVMENGVKHYWNIDRWAPELDEELKSYLDKIDQTLIELKK